MMKMKLLWEDLQAGIIRSDLKSFKNLAGNAVSEYEQNRYETFGNNLPQPLCATCYPIYAPCEEGLYRTSIKPEGWNSNMDRGFIN